MDLEMRRPATPAAVLYVSPVDKGAAANLRRHTLRLTSRGESLFFAAGVTEMSDSHPLFWPTTDVSSSP